MATLRFATLNVSGLRNPVKRFSLHRLLLSLHLDIVGLQETHWATDDEHSLWSGDFPYYDCYSSLGSSRQCGVTTLVAKRLHATTTRTYVDQEGRVVSLSLSVNGTDINVTNVYCPCPIAERVLFFNTVLSPLLALTHHFLMGDFNTVLDPRLDSLTLSRAQPDRAARLLHNIFRSNSYVDSFRSLNPTSHGFTWKRCSNAYTQMCRLDLLVTSPDILSSVQNVDICPWQWSDHLLLSCTVACADVLRRGPGYWHMNVAALANNDYSDSVECFWSAWRLEKRRFQNLVDWWEIGKCYLRDLTRQYCIEWTASRRRRRVELQKTFTACHHRLLVEPSSASAVTRETIKSVEVELRQLDNSDLTGMKIRSCENGEKSAGFFGGHERSRQRQAMLTELDMDDCKCNTTAVA